MAAWKEALKLIAFFSSPPVVQDGTRNFKAERFQLGTGEPESRIERNRSKD